MAVMTVMTVMTAVRAEGAAQRPESRRVADAPAAASPSGRPVLLETGGDVATDQLDPREVIRGPHDGSITTRSAPPPLSEATRNASAASSIGNRWVIRVRAMSGSSASMAAASSISRPPSCAQ